MGRGASKVMRDLGAQGPREAARPMVLMRAKNRFSRKEATEFQSLESLDYYQPR